MQGIRRINATWACWHVGVSGPGGSDGVRRLPCWSAAFFNGGIKCCHGEWVETLNVLRVQVTILRDFPGI